MRHVLRRAGGLLVRSAGVATLRLSLWEREEISRRRESDAPSRAIARVLGRAPMGERLAFTLVTNCQVYFCHPRGPWQRGTNENANELLWQDLQRALQFFAFPERDLDGIAAELNAQPMRQVTVGVLPR